MENVKDPSKDIKGESEVVLRENAGISEPTVIRNLEQYILARHPVNELEKDDWFHLEKSVIPAIQKEVLDDFKAHLQFLCLPFAVDQQTPFELTLSFYKKFEPESEDELEDFEDADGKKSMLAKVNERLLPAENLPSEDVCEALLGRLPKMLYKLKKFHEKAKMLMVSFEWQESVDSAPMSKLVQVLEREKIHKATGKFSDPFAAVKKPTK